MVFDAQSRATPIAFHEWLAGVMETGESILPQPPSLWRWDLARVRDLIHHYHRWDGWHLAGPELALDLDAALGAVRLLAAACWELVSPQTGQLARELEGLPRPHPNQGASTIQAVDLFFRFFPSVLFRARLREHGQPLVQQIETILKPWPLSALLTQPESEPGNDLNFFDHAGLQLRYAQRLLKHPLPAWVPPSGASRSWAEWVFAEQGRPLPEKPKDPTSPSTE